MKPSKAAIKAAGEAFVKWETIENMLKAAYDAQFGDETLYRKVEWKGHVRWEPIGDDDE